MKKLSLNASAFQKGEVLTRSQLKKVLGGDGSGGTESDDCTGNYFFVVKPTYCGYGVGSRLPNGDCMIHEPADKIPQPCGFA